MGDKNVNIGINFQINKQNLDSLQKSLDDIILKSKQFAAAAPDYAGPYEEAAEAAKDLKNILTSSWNTQLGQLDLSKVEKELINLYGSTKDFKNILSQIGPEGQKVFNQFTNAVISTQAPIKQTSAMLDRMAVTFKNTIRYGISSAVWNNFSRSVSKAYSYVQDLDKSLNDIRIVSGQSADQMARFAVQANKAAKELGATTLEYTKGALIYYQQGLSDEEVKQRTDVTVKMAHVTESSTQEISDYMTAIWNNFYTGAQSLEYFGDVLAKLGAETASSAEEISTGLEKFAAISKTVGLTYDYAAAALTTVTDKTRQSAEVVGTAFKTLFARIQDLELGDEGSVTIGKYAEALEKFDIHVLDSNGNLKQMNDILDEMGSKWGSMTDAQKVALAQNVAGIRQYTQLMALMENWGDFEINVASAQSASGTLEQQQNVYLDSLEAHLNQLDAAWEGLYDNIFDEEFMKTLTDALTGIVNLANTFVTGLGGGLNSVIYLAMTLGNIFSNQVSDGILRVKLNAEGAAEKIKNIAVQSRFIKEMQGTGRAETINKQGIKEYMQEQEITAEIASIKGKMGEDEQEALAIMEKETEELREQNDILNLIAAKEGLDTGKAEKKINKNKNLSDKEKEAEIQKIREEAQEKFKNASPKEQKKMIMDDLSNRISDNDEKIRKNNALISAIGKGGELTESQFKQLDAVAKALQSKMRALNKLKKEFENIEKTRELTKAEEETKKSLEAEIKLRQKQISITKNAANSKKPINDQNYKEPNEIINAVQTQNEYLQYNNQLYKNANEYLAKQKDFHLDNIKTAIIENEKTIKRNQELRKGLVVTQDQRDAMNSIVSTTMTLGTSISSVVGLFKTLSNPDLSSWDQLSSIFSVLGTQMLMIVGNWENIQKILPSILVMTGKEATLETAIASVKAKGLLVTIKEIALNAIEIVQKTIINLLSGKITAAGVALVAAMAVGVVLIGKWVAKFIEANKEENKLKKKIEETTEAIKKAKEAYQQLSDTVSKYKDAKAGIDALTEGTIEFYDAIMKSNESAQELIDKLNLIAGQDYSIDKNGLITINNESLENAIFREQQKVFQAQGANAQARYNMAAYNRDQIVKEFQQKVNTKDGLGYGFSRSQAESILNRENEKRELMSENKTGNKYAISQMGLSEWEDIKSTFKQGFDNVTSNAWSTAALMSRPLETMSVAFAQEALVDGKTKDGIIDITEEVGQFRAEYNKYSAEMLALNREATIANIRAYGSKEQIEIFNALNSMQQDIVTDFATKQKEIFSQENKEKSGWASFWDTSDKGFWGKAGIGILKGLGYASSTLLGGSNGVKAWNKTISSEDQLSDLDIKKLYAENVLGYTQEDGKWRDSAGNKIKEKEIKKIDLETAKDAYFSGEYSTKDSLNTMISAIQESRKLSSKANFNSDSSDYIAEALTSLMSGNTQYNFQALSKDELEEVRKQAVSYIDEIAGSGEKFDTFRNFLQAADRELDEQANILARNTRDLKNYNELLENSAEKLGTTSSALKVYDAALQNAENGIVKYSTSMAQAAIVSYKFNKSYNQGRKIFNDNKDAWNIYIKALQKGEKISYDVADASGEILESLKGMGIELSTEELKNPESLEQIETLLSGTAEEAEEAYKKLRDQSWVNNLVSGFGMAKNKAEEFIETLNSLKEGDSIDVSKWSEAFGNQKKTLEDWKAWAEQYGIQVDVDVPEQDLKETKPNSTTRRTTHRISAHKEGDRDIPAYTYVEEITDEAPTLYSFGDLKLTKGGTPKTNFTASPSGGSKSSGGGSSSKKKEEKSKNEVDRYHVVNTQISKVDNSLKKIQKQQEKTLGKDLLNLLIKQWKELETQVDNYKEKLKIAQGEYRELEYALTKQGVKFNEDGTVANYFDILKQKEKELNDIIDNYNSMSAKQQENYEDTLNKAKENFEKFKTNIDRIDTLASSEIPGIVQSIHDTIDEEIENNIKAFSLEVELSLDIKEAQQAWNNFKEQMVNSLRDEDIFGKIGLTSNNLKTLLSNNGQNGYQGDLVNQVEHVYEVMKQIKLQEQGLANVYGDNTAAALEDLKKWLDEARSSYEAVVEYQKEIHQSYLDMLDQAKEKLDEQITDYEQITSLLEHDKHLIELTYGEKAYSILDKYYKLQKQNNKDELKTLKAQEDFYKTRLDIAQAEMQNAKAARDAEDAESDAWKQRNSKYLETLEVFNKTKEQWEASVSKSNEALEKSIEDAQASLENTINLITQTLAQSLTGKTGGLDYAEEEWDLINRNADQYLDTINRLQGENSLESKYLDSINKAVNPSIQKKLKDAMNSEMKALREKDKLSQYDLDRANKRYQIMLAEIALEEAQQNKNKMRLRRDSQGNYRYQYVADEDQINKAKEELSTLYTDLYNFDKERYKSTLSEIESTTKEFQEKLAEISKISDPEERLEKEALLRQEYEQLFTAIKEQAETARGNLTDSAFDDLSLLQNKNKEEFLAMTKEETDALMGELVPAWNSVNEAIVQNMEPLDYVNGAIDQQREAFEEVNLEIEEYLNIMDKAKDKISQTTDEDIDKINEFINNNLDLIDLYDDGLNQLIELINTTDELIDSYKNETSAIEILTEAYDKWNDSMKDALKTYDEYSKNPSMVTNPEESIFNETPGGDEVYTESTGDAEENNKPNVTDSLPRSTRLSKNQVKELQSFLNDMGYGAGAVDGIVGRKTKAALKQFQNLIGTKADGVWGPNTYDRAKAAGYDTGGYTGDWGNGGRLAFLHQKELVLNSKDTENILNTVAIMRNLMTSLNENILSKLANVSAGSITGVNGGNDLLEQNVHIEANFPNVTNSNEIEEAIKNLVNVASQRVTK